MINLDSWRDKVISAHMKGPLNSEDHNITFFWSKIEFKEPKRPLIAGLCVEVQMLGSHFLKVTSPVENHNEDKSVEVLVNPSAISMLMTINPESVLHPSNSLYIRPANNEGDTNNDRC